LLCNDKVELFILPLHFKMLSSINKPNCATRNGEPQILRRSVKHLFPIKVRSELTQKPNINNSSSPIPESNERSSTGQPRRQVAMLGQ